MMTIIGRDGRERTEADDYVLADGEALRVPWFMIDHARNQMIEAMQKEYSMKVVDALGREAGFRPGFVFAADGGDDRREAAFQTSKRELRNAWRNPQRQSHAMEPIALQQQHDQRQMTSDEAYNLMCQELRDGWRQRR